MVINPRPPLLRLTNMKRKLKTIMKGVRLSNGESHIWVFDKAISKMVKVDYTDLGMSFFSKRNAN